MKKNISMCLMFLSIFVWEQYSELRADTIQSYQGSGRADRFWQDGDSKKRFRRQDDLREVVASHSGGKQKKQNEKEWIAQTKVMYDIIEKYKEDGFVSTEDKDTYKTILIKMQNYVKQFENNPRELKRYKNTFLNPYKAWAKFILADHVSPEHQQLKNNTSEIKKTFEMVESKIDQAVDSFTNQVSGYLTGLGSDTQRNRNEIYTNIAGAEDTFATRMTTIQRNAINDYFAYARKQGQEVNVVDLTLDQHMLVKGVQSLIQKTKFQVKGVVLALTSEVGIKQLESETGRAIELYEKQAQTDYERMLEENKRADDIDWWQELTSSGKRLLAIAITKIKQEAAKQSAELITNVAKEHGGQIAGEIGKRAKDVIPESLIDALKGLSEKLKSSRLAELIEDNGPAINALRKAITVLHPVAEDQEGVNVQVSTGTELSQEEKTYIKNRLLRVKPSLKREFDIDQPLRVAFSCGGGGSRAMIGTLGFLTAAARHKFLDVSMYLTGLSGSSWMIAPWSYMHMTGSSKNYTNSLAEFKKMLVTTLNYPCDAKLNGSCLPDQLQSNIIPSFQDHIVKRFGYDQTITAVDVYGPLVANLVLRKLGADALDVTWSSLTERAQRGTMPLPLCSSVFDTKSGSLQGGSYENYEWFETGPFQAGSPGLGYIPNWAIGSQFKNGKLTSHAPEYPLSYWLGVYGSVFSLSINDVIDKQLPKATINILGLETVELPVNEWLRTMLDAARSDLRNKRAGVTHAQFPNYSQGSSSSVLASKDTIGMFDAVLSFNNPLPILFDRPEREVDVAIMYDSNSGDRNTLNDATDYFKRKGIAMPDMTKAIKGYNLMSKPMTVFNDPRTQDYVAEEPTLIYFPTPQRIDSSKSPYATLNFKYSSADIDKLTKTMEDAFTSQVDDMKEIMKLVSKKRKRN